MEYSGKVIWITGASSGIGEALAEALAARGAHIILSGRRTDALQAVADRLPTESLVLLFETTDRDALPGIVERAIAWKGQVDGLVNNAGISQRALAVDSALEVYDRIIAVDLLAPIWLTQLLLPHMTARKAGMIVGISSVAGRAGVPLRTAYCAAKHGLIGYLDALRAETEVHYGLKVHTVLPGSIRRPFPPTRSRATAAPSAAPTARSPMAWTRRNAHRASWRASMRASRRSWSPKGSRT